ncbi:MAG TPA: hypothetical protein VIK54_11805 [Acidimicrobiia bacterium]
MLIQARFADPIASGAVTLTFRRWKRPQVVAGSTYRTAAGRVVVDAVDVVDPDRISDADAKRAGFASRSELLAGLRGTSELPTYRIRFRPADGPDPRSVLAATVTLSNDDVAEIRLRLARLDRASSHGSWTAEVLRTIAARPGVRAADLAASFGRETQAFKVDVRKLKNLGLTSSLEVGYRLSPRGEAYLATAHAS